ncbi:MAG: AmmeMemoRadiSam system protein A [Gammaproteobacteria bacterium]|nr:AmmeMemoRadiSam system protein A [Gammaproteobacteria bacterium]MBU0788502.1 AmmeMemoRadiSam system protein A [Gammaproteobacteria bacterium]MBU0815674.1 AmmeMemoRadiSam system protein A [Gammaproteobacteria bacterium]MBU1788118.1 AmmeMemoRadiSam system protein A [Gammaproteobacteria bacterium]
MTSTEQGRTLLPIARASIARALGRSHVASEEAPWLQTNGACFVTLTQQGELRGCIGSLEARRPLLADVKANALAAAFHDPRFSPLEAHELDRTEIEVSLLSAMQEMPCSTESDALSQLQPGIDGVLMEFGRHRGTFLPQVWAQLPSARDFLMHLKRKAGLPHDFWAQDIRLYRYNVNKWTESDISREVSESPVPQA